MKKMFFGLLATSVLASCVVGQNGNLSGGFIFNETTGPIDASSAKISDKTGQACIKNILGVVSTGDSSIKAAAKNGGIKEVATVDVKVKTILGLYGESCTIVTGQ